MLADMILESLSSSFSGTGTYELNGAVGAYDPWRSAFATGATVLYLATNVDGSIWEEGWGVLTQASPDTISRNLIKSSTGSLIDWQTTDGPVYIYSPQSNEVAVTQVAAIADRPAWARPGLMWRKADAPSSGKVTLKIFDGTNDHDIGILDTVAGTFNFTGGITGETKGFRGTAAQVPDGWTVENGGTIGDAASGATNVAGDEAEALFKLLWPNSNYSVQNSSGSATSKGASADADWTAHKRLVLLDMNNKFRRGTTGTPGGTGGADTHAHTYSNAISVFGSGTTANAVHTAQSSGGVDIFVIGDHSHSFSVTSSGTSSGTTASASNVPVYVSEISMIKL